MWNKDILILLFYTLQDSMYLAAISDPDDCTSLVLEFQSPTPKYQFT